MLVYVDEHTLDRWDHIAVAPPADLVPEILGEGQQAELSARELQSTFVAPRRVPGVAQTGGTTDVLTPLDGARRRRGSESVARRDNALARFETDKALVAHVVDRWSIEVPEVGNLARHPPAACAVRPGRTASDGFDASMAATCGTRSALPLCLRSFWSCG